MTAYDNSIKRKQGLTVIKQLVLFYADNKIYKAGIVDSDTPKQDKKSWTMRFRKPGKHMFWAWIAYQSVKGMLTTSLIWIPLIWGWMHS